MSGTPEEPCLHAAVAAVDITPAGPQWLDGFAARTAPSRGAYLPIRAVALRLQCGGRAALLLSAEVLALDPARTGALKTRLAEAASVPPGSVVLTATHTHCAPRVCDTVMPGRVDADYLALFEARCVEAARQAAGPAIPVRIACSAAEDRLGINRRLPREGVAVAAPNPDGPRDAVVRTLWLERLDGGGVLASVTTAATHPTCRGGELVGGDYPGFLARELERATGGVAMFVLGCAGDVRPNFTDGAGHFRMAELAEVEVAGRELARAVLAGARRSLPAEPSCLEVRCRTEGMPLAAPPPVGELERIAAEDPSPFRREWAGRLLRAGAPRPEAIPFEMQLLRLARQGTPVLEVLFWPGEVAAEYALWARSELARPDCELLTAAYANGAVGYVPSAAMLPLGGYEVDGSHFYYNLPAPYAPGLEDRFRHCTRRLLE